jgi:hypothetical protein
MLKAKTGFFPLYIDFSLFRCLRLKFTRKSPDTSGYPYTVSSGVTFLVLTTNRRSQISPTSSTMSEYGTGTQQPKGQLSSTSESSFTQFKGRHTYPDVLNSRPQTPAGSHAALSKRAPAVASDSSQQALNLTSEVGSHSQQQSFIDTRQPADNITNEDFEALLRLAYKRLEDPEQKADEFTKDGKYAKGTRDCISLTKASNGAPIHKRASHKERVIRQLPWNHNWSPWKEFANANSCDLFYCKNQNCPSFHVPLLRHKQDHIEERSERVEEYIPTDFELLKAEYGCPEATSKDIQYVLEGFNQSPAVGRAHVRSIFELQDSAAAIQRKGWSDLITNRNIEIVKQAKEESERRGSTEGSSVA